ncbi:MAG TPA: undecaprenyl-phosphate glucose phosphotransferase [Gammaproteobacteria bacterium]|jgi:putative colanic acid biosynthesis UDP-glucose lipid carrier transferase|nr:undecaprenyl-phosphate glucose phosphotransferase [Gammaproteobacteria bacterium]
MLPKGLLKEHFRAISLMIRLADMCVVFFAGWLAYVLKFSTLGFLTHFSHFTTLAIDPAYLKAIFIGMVLTVFVFSSFNIYASLRGKTFSSHFSRLMKAIAILAILLAGVAFFTKSGEIYSRVWFAMWMMFTVLFIVLYRYGVLCFLTFMRTRGLNERRVVILGAGELGIKIANTIQHALWTGFRVMSLIDDDAEKKPASINGIPVIQTPEALDVYLSEHAIDEIWLALPLRAEARMKEILHILRHHMITTRFVLDIFGLDLMSHSITDIAGFPVLNIRSTPMQGVNRVVKAIEDRLLAALILVLISPLFLLITVLVKLQSRGSVFFKQERLGWDGCVIKVYKFRTMYEHIEDEGAVTQATLDDKRVTPLGRFLRRTSLDELPQFINVLQGRMSIVGPRPHALAHNEYYKDTVHTYMQRHCVKPGITGWAQVNGWRGETKTLDKMQKRVEYDLYYINNWSLRFDLKIILMTCWRGFISRNAY